MLKLLILKELKSLILGPKFVGTFAVCSLLILLSVFVGIREYRNAVKQYEAATQLVDQEMRERSSWMGFSSRTFRQPDPMQIFVSGVNNDVGRLSAIDSFEDIKLRNSIYSDDPIFAFFRFIDFTFIGQVVLSLFAILFTYDAINGEREGGTLQLTFSNAVPRVKYVLGKFVGSWLGMVIPLLLPVLLGILLLVIYNIPFTATHWAKLFTFLGVTLLYFTCFIATGLLVSTLTRNSAVSFLLLLVIWVTFVLIIPRAGVMMAGQLVNVPTVAEIEGLQDGYEKNRWDKHGDELEVRWRERNAQMAGMSVDEREAYQDEHLLEWTEQEDQARRTMQKDIIENSRKLNEDLRNRKAGLERLAFTLSRFSPASSYQLAAMSLAGTGIEIKTNYEDAMRNYRTTFVDYVEKKRKASGGVGGIRITMDTETGFKLSTDRDQGTLDLNDLPRFVPPQHNFAEALAPAAPDFGLLAFYTIAAFAGAFVAFLRYDVR